MKSLENYFQFSENNTRWRVEIMAGITTFLAMLYIIVVNAKILSQTGMSAPALVTSTVIISSFSSIAMGIYARNPYALAPAMGMNVFFTYTIVKAWGIPWETALGAVFWSGVLFVLLAVFNIRTKILAGIPNAVKHGIGAGIGIFIALVGFYNAGFIRQAPSGLLEITPLSAQTFVFLICFFILAILMALRFRAAMLLTIIVGCVLALPFGRIFGEHVLLHVPSHIVALPDFSLFFSIDWLGSLKVALLPAIFTFLFINIFDSTGVLLGLAHTCNWFDKNGQPIRIRQSLLVDSVAASAAGLVGNTPTAIFVESATGIAAGGRTGVVSIVVGLLFLPFLFLAPLVIMVPVFVVAPALVMVGCLMMASIQHVKWNDLTQAIPTFVTIVLMPLTLSISEGIVWGMVTWFLISLFHNRKALTPMSVIITVCCFLIMLSSLSVL
ncbi:NCS2 family permease [Fangia hongkongensis]|uniref:NCS2 family permease n=1 Tax=Fangia hongkongensis TaxID=270495 RepID=UPI00039E42E3|nr:NCS2 family permease [Fangia hongkongensis]MBK2126349.1 NCS2 family permease [Fangia hongkongensis]